MRLFGTFKRHVGAVADVKELQYVSAIHQTALPELRIDGTISAKDVQYFLRSRFGLVVSDAYAVDIVRGLTGTHDTEKSEDKHKKRRLFHKAEKRKEKNSHPAVQEESGTPSDEEGVLSSTLDDESTSTNTPDEAIEYSMEKSPAAQDVSDLAQVPDKDNKKGDSAEKATNDNAYDETKEVVDVSKETSDETSKEARVETKEQVDEKSKKDTVLGSKKDSTVPSKLKPSKPIWRSYMDSEYNRLYYYNRLTRQTTWTKPLNDDSDEYLLTQETQDTDQTRKDSKDSEKYGHESEPQASFPEDDTAEMDKGRNTAESSASTSNNCYSNKETPSTFNPMHIDLRTNWSLKTRVKKKKEEADVEPPTTADMIRMDMVQMMAIMLIPTFIRADQPMAETQIQPPTETESEPEKWDVLVNPWTHYQKMVQKRNQAEKDALNPREGLIEDVLRLLLASLDYNDDDRNDNMTVSQRCEMLVGDSLTSRPTGQDLFPKLKHTLVSEKLVRSLLRKHGELKAAENDELVKEMVDMVGGEGEVFDEKAFGMGLTMDVSQWPAGREDNLSTTFSDVYGFKLIEYNMYASSNDPSIDEVAADRSAVDVAAAELGRAVGSIKSLAASEVRSQRHGETRHGETASADEPKYRPTASYIDYAMDNFRSIGFVTFLFVFFIVECAFIMSIVYRTGITTFKCTLDEFWCKLLETVWSWLVLAVILCLGGLLITVPISLGNHQYQTSCAFQWFALLVLAVYTIWPVVYSALIDEDKIQVSEKWKELTDRVEVRPMLISLLASSGLTCVEVFRGMIGSVISIETFKKMEVVRGLFMPSNIRRSRNTKRSGTHKLNSLVENAHKLHRQAHHQNETENPDDAAMLNFVISSANTEEIGGFWWTWRRILFARPLIKKEGIWIHSRFVVGQVSQVAVLAVLVTVWLVGVEYAADQAEQKRQQLVDSGGLASSLELRVVPTYETIMYSCIPGGIISFCFAILLIFVYLPSTVSVILRFRNGIIPSLHDPLFSYKYRKKPDTIYYNLGNMIYALVGSILLFFLIFAGFIFLLLWPITQDFMIVLVAWGIGLAITICLKMLITMFFRSIFYQAFYRTRPFAANMSTLALECWHLGLGGGVVLQRLCQFLLAAAFWIGRIDSAFLSDEVGMAGYKFDYVPSYYRVELLVHEAHRHPYIERLSAMYLMRLKYGENFGSAAGAMWRQLFVLTLMPWLLKYRQGNGLAKECDEDEVGFDRCVASVQKPPRTGDSFADRAHLVGPT